jgi:hypothetical protein
MNPLAVAVQGLGFDAAMVAVQGLLAFVVLEVKKFEEFGGASSKRKSRHAVPNWLPQIPVEDDESLLLIGAL